MENTKETESLHDYEVSWRCGSTVGTVRLCGAPARGALFSHTFIVPITMGKRMPDIRIPCDRATELTGQGRFDEAILVMKSVIRSDSNNPNIWYSKGLILYKLPLQPVFTVPVTGLPADTSRAILAGTLPPVNASRPAPAARTSGAAGERSPAGPGRLR